MKKKKVYNDFLPQLDVAGSFNHPEYQIDWKLPTPIHPTILSNIDNGDSYDCLLDPLASLLDMIEISSEMFNTCVVVEYDKNP